MRVSKVREQAYALIVFATIVKGQRYKEGGGLVTCARNVREEALRIGTSATDILKVPLNAS